MKKLREKCFANGVVYALELADGCPIETTSTFLPFYTKEAEHQQTNELRDSDLGSRAERWMIGVSTMSGCPVGCKFCATGKLPAWRNLTTEEIMAQVKFALVAVDDDPFEAKEFKINYTRMGEPFLNLDNVRGAIAMLDEAWVGTCAASPRIHHYVSTIGLRGSDFSWIKDNITLQISLHSLNEERRRELIPFKNLMSLEELGQIRTGSNLKTTLNLTLVDEADFDIDVLTRYFDPEHFFIKLSPINVNSISEANGLGAGVIEQQNLL